MYISKKFREMPFGGLYEIFGKANKIEATGKKLIHMEMGRPDFVSPDIAIEAVKESLHRGEVHYTEMEGVPPLRKAIAEKEERRHGLKYSPEDEIVVTSGACEALASVFLSFLDPGDEVIVFGPYFSAYYEQSLLFNFNLIELELKMDDQWKLDINQLKELITPKTKMILINSPNNPAGYILKDEELEMLANIAKEHDLLVVSDECYDEFSYIGDLKSIATIEGMRERTLVVKSTSKSFSMTGWRIGYVLAPAEFCKYISKAHQNMSTCSTSFAQYGAVKAFQEGDAFIDHMVSTFEERGNYFYEKLSNIEGLEILKPQGAFYFFPKITNYGKSEFEIIDILLEEAGVVGVPGTFFGKSGEGHIRLAYCRSMEELEEAATNMKRVLESL
ncbi:MAG: pyridoxal phosphate-dependent aminotransferase [Tissierellia bacterium]|nr:pyridoxal phosphate-dependent aminotransferase [Tissierellia bacterium]